MKSSRFPTVRQMGIPLYILEPKIELGSSFCLFSLFWGVAELLEKNKGTLGAGGRQAVRRRPFAHCLDLRWVYGSRLDAPQGQDKDEQNEEETIEQILQYDKSVAAIYCQLKVYYGTQVSRLPLLRDVVEIVALLGKVDDDNLSRLISNYLGIETMSAFVCKTHDETHAMETYDKEGFIDKSTGLHGL
ncbi:putative protein IQ-DOMAIN 1-like [Capsicum annuum]|nr:putative protein IQ-DOMAIN 1-like [Capsicum annuum]